MKRHGFSQRELLTLLILFVILGAIVFSVYRQAGDKNNASSCLSNQRQVAMAILSYAQDHDNFFPDAVTVWHSLPLPAGVFRCHSNLHLANGYNYNGLIAGKALHGLWQDTTTIMLTADGIGESNIAQTDADLDERHNGYLIASFADGHVQRCHRRDLLTGFPGPLYAIGHMLEERKSDTSQSIETSPNAWEFKLAPVAGCPDIISASVGAEHSLAVKADGSVWAWGSNCYGELGSQSPSQNTPINIPQLHNIIAVAAGMYSSLALGKDGTVWAWGESFRRNLRFDLPTADPTPIPGLSGVIAISSGQQHFLALKADGSVWAWGQGILGTHTGYEVGQVAGLPNIIAISAGAYHNLALDTYGNVWAWGSNNFGEIGDGKGRMGKRQPKPLQVPGLHQVVAISAGSGRSAAVTADGAVWAWGDSAIAGQGKGKLIIVGTSSAMPDSEAKAKEKQGNGNQSIATHSSPVRIAEINNAESVACYRQGIFILQDDGSVWAYGSADVDKLVLGNEASSNQCHPVRIPGIHAMAFASGGYSGAQPDLFITMP